MAEIFTIKVGRVQSATSLQSNESAIEIDNHADTKVLGSNFLPIHDFRKLAYVYGWYASAGSVKRPTISEAIAYDHPKSGKVYMLVYH